MNVCYLGFRNQTDTEKSDLATFNFSAVYYRGGDILW